MNEYNEALQNLLKVLDEKMLQIGTNLEKCQIILDNTVKLAREFVEKNKINFNESAPIINDNLTGDPHQPSGDLKANEELEFATNQDFKLEEDLTNEEEIL